MQTLLAEFIRLLLRERMNDAKSRTSSESEASRGAKTREAATARSKLSVRRKESSARFLRAPSSLAERISEVDKGGRHRGIGRQQENEKYEGQDDLPTCPA